MLLFFIIVFHKLAIRMQKICNLMRLLNIKKHFPQFFVAFSLIAFPWTLYRVFKGSNLELYLWEFMLQFIVFLLFIANICSNNIMYLSIYLSIFIYQSIYRYIQPNAQNFCNKTFSCFVFLRGNQKFIPRILFEIGNWF